MGFLPSSCQYARLEKLSWKMTFPVGGDVVTAPVGGGVVMAAPVGGGVVPELATMAMSRKISTTPTPAPARTHARLERRRRCLPGGLPESEGGQAVAGV